MIAAYHSTSYQPYSVHCKSSFVSTLSVLLSVLLSVCLFAACQSRPSTPLSSLPPDTRLLFDPGQYPHAIFHAGRYYYTCQDPAGNRISLRVSTELEGLDTATEHRILPSPDLDLMHIWAPELHRIQNQWYLYFEADDGNTDNHHLYVLQSADADPTNAHWQLCGPLQTCSEWNYGIHPTVLQMPTDELYLIWSGWPQRRAETETQCIYIARLSDPCTVASERVLLSAPEQEWERQWINPDGSRAAYPIYVNENPQASLTPDGRHVCIHYSASGIWTVYNSLGQLTAPATADLLDPASWTKNTEPIQLLADSVHYGTSNVCLVNTGRGQQALLFEAKFIQDGAEHRAVFLRRDVTFGQDGLPQL